MENFEFIIKLSSRRKYSIEEKNIILRQLKSRMEGYSCKIDFDGEIKINHHIDSKKNKE